MGQRCVGGLATTSQVGALERAILRRAALKTDENGSRPPMVPLDIGNPPNPLCERAEKGDLFPGPFDAPLACAEHAEAASGTISTEPERLLMLTADRPRV